MTDTPLSKFYRQPAIHIHLPSGGKYWKEGSLKLSANLEYPVLPMNGKDDLAMRNADGLMNGASTVSMLQSCFPNIKNAWDAPSIDMDTMLIAVRIATYGGVMSFDTKCAKCNEDLSYEADLMNIKDSIELPNYDQPVTVNDLMIWFRPNTYKEANDANQENYIQQRTLLAMQSSQFTEEEKIAKFKEAVAELTANTVAKVANFIDYIITPDGEKVTDRQQITEFVENADQKTFTGISSALAELNAQYKIPTIKIKCNCGHEDERNFQFDPSSFFA